MLDLTRDIHSAPLYYMCLCLLTHKNKIKRKLNKMQCISIYKLPILLPPICRNLEKCLFFSSKK